MLCAAVDVGSNSVHLLVARLSRGALEPQRDESVLLGLGDVVDAEGLVTEHAAAMLIGTLRDYCLVAQGMGAQTVTFVATEPLRRAANSVALTEQVREETGLPLHVLSVRQEGQLTYLGVTGGRAPQGSLLMADIGGGSSEVILATAGEPLAVASLPSGSARLSRELVRQDPPAGHEIDAMLAAGHALVDQLPPGSPDRAVFVGGTATNLARLAPLSRDGLALAYRSLTTLPAQEISRRFGVNLRRARQLAAGAALVDAILARYGLAEAEVSAASLREGAILAAEALGDEWPARLDELIDGSLLLGSRSRGSHDPPPVRGHPASAPAE
jgi:exopolyphosphatase/pppGpp-phosphohydrolase